MTPLNDIATEELRRVDLRTVGVLVTVHLSCYQARKCDRKVSHEAAVRAGATDKAGRFNKQLIDTDAYIKPIRHIQGKIREHHYRHTLPWMDSFRILNMKLYEDYCSKMNNLIDEHDKAVTDFLAVYPQAKQEARQFLGNMYDEDEYPTVEEVKEKFDADYYMQPIPDTEDFRVQLPEGMVQHTAEKIAAAYEQAQGDAWRRLYDCVEDIATKLPAFDRGEQRHFRDSLVDNLRELLDIMPGLNIAGDVKLDFFASKANQLTVADAKMLREDETLRKTTADKARDILEKMPFAK